MRCMHYFGVILSLAALTNCGGGQQQATAPAAEMVPDQGAAPSGVGEAHEEPAAVEWAAMNEAERKQYMKDVVLPKMATVLHSGDPEEFAEVNCATCHGSNAGSGVFEMPNPELHQLDPSNDFAEAREEYPEMVEFMAQRVVPEMATLLGVKPYDPATQQGFGCFHCHTMKPAEPPAGT